MFCIRLVISLISHIVVQFLCVLRGVGPETGRGVRLEGSEMFRLKSSK